MKKVYSYILIFFAFIPVLGYSQYSWNRFTNKSEYIAGIGPSQFLGDLGGSSSVGTHFLKDFNFTSIRYALELGYRYHINPYFAAKGMLTTALLYGSDALSTNNVRHNRNINFRSPLIEASGQFEFYFYRNSQIGHKYHIRHAKGFQKLNIDGYVFAGVGGFYFDPAAKYTNGLWYSLPPMSTEGEGLPGGPKPYSQFAFTVPVGIGFKYSINTEWTVGMEISDRIWTSTDYLDDTHGNYYNNATILQDKGPIAAYFADPSLHEIGGASATGTMRGDPTHNDTYMFLFFTVTYQPPFHRRTRSKF
jgi:hypothetical protein